MFSVQHIELELKNSYCSCGSLLKCVTLLITERCVTQQNESYVGKLFQPYSSKRKRVKLTRTIEITTQCSLHAMLESTKK